MNKLLTRILAFIFLVMMVQSCTDEIEYIDKDYTDNEYDLISKSLNLPISIHDYTPDFSNNSFSHLGGSQSLSKRTNHKATLGRVLFYDTQLSINNEISCASCHKPELAFADDVAFSEGFDGQLTTRNSLPLGNTIGFETAYGGSFSRAQFGWDESNHDIASQSRAAILSEIEMGLDMFQLEQRLQNDEVYNVLFKKAYGEPGIQEHKILDALEEFVNRIVSKNSRFDYESRNKENGIFESFDGFTEMENLGKELFNNNCGRCHSFDHTLTTKAVANNGLDIEYEDKGVGERTGLLEDWGVFKVPFLRNIELTAPYMHDGRFASLRDVIDHYSEGIQDHKNLDLELKKNGKPGNMNFTETEKQALEAYLKTLTDDSIAYEEKYADPFK